MTLLTALPDCDYQGDTDWPSTIPGLWNENYSASLSPRALLSDLHLVLYHQRVIPMTRARILLICSVPFVCSSAIAQRAPIPQQLTFTPYHANGLYKIGETVGWTVSQGPDAPTYAYKWTIRRNNAVVLKEGKLDLSSGKDKIEIVGDQPEMIYVAIEPYAALAVAPNAPSASSTSAGQSGSAPPIKNITALDAASTAAAQSGSTG